MKAKKDIAEFYPESRVFSKCTIYGEAEAIYFQKALNFPFHLYSAGITSSADSEKTHCHNFPIAHLEYVISGKGYIEDKDKIITVNAGDCFILPQNKVQHYYADKKTPGEKCGLIFQEAYHAP